MPKVATFTFDSKLDFVGLYRDYPSLLAIHWGWLRFNPLQVPPQVGPAEWRNFFVDLFSGVFTIGDVGYSILLQAIDKLYRDSGVYQGKDLFPTIRDLRRLLDAESKGSNSLRKREAFSSLLNRLDGLLITWPAGLDYHQGYCVPELITGHIVLAIHGLAGQHRAFLISLICLWAYSYLEANNLRGDALRVLFVVDEAEVILGKDVRKSLCREPLFFTSIPKFREFSIGLIVASQSPRGLDERAVMALAHTKVVKNLESGDDIDYMGRSLSWTPEQRAYCRAMPAHQAMTSIGVSQPQTILVQVPFTQVNKKVDWNQLQSIMQPRMAQKFPTHQAIPAPKPSHAPPSSDADQKRLLVDVANRPHLPKTERLQALFGNSSSKSQRIADQCVHAGYVKEYKVSVGGRSGMIILWRLKNKGCDYIGLPRQPIPGIGDVVHQHLQYRVSEKLKQWGEKPEIEMLRCGKRVDVGIDVGARMIAFEIATTPKNEVENVKKDVDAGFAVVVVLPVDEKVKKSVERKFNKELSTRYQGRARVLTIESFLQLQSMIW